MKYIIVFTLFALYLVALACCIGGWGWLLLWPALSSALVAAGYAGLGPMVFGKRDNGRLAWWAVLLLLPYLLVTWGLWHLQRLLSREPCCHEVAPGVWLGRRPLHRDLPAGVVLVVDLTAEFFVARGVRSGREYLVLPTLDASAPDEARFRALLLRLAEHPGPVYLHCAAGHGRSALLAAALLLARGLASDDRQAEERLRQVRPGVRLLPGQRRLLRRLFSQDSADRQGKNGASGAV
jgi:protein-tyrosine phosphatase